MAAQGAGLAAEAKGARSRQQAARLARLARSAPAVKEKSPAARARNHRLPLPARSHNRRRNRYAAKLHS